MVERNWAANVTFGAARVHRPESIDQLQQIVADAAAAGRRVHAAGSRHSFSTVADTEGDLVSMERMNRIVGIDRDAGTVTVEGGIRYGELASALQADGLALHNLPSLPHITVAGAVATGTHGSGDGNANLASAVSTIELVDAAGQLVRVSPETTPGDFDGAVVALGALGVAARLTLAVEPTFDVAQDVYRSLPIGLAIDHLDELMASAYSVSLFTDWTSATVHQVWCKRRVDAGAGAGSVDVADTPGELFGAQRASLALHPVEAVSAEACTEQLGVSGAWHDRLPHFRLDFTPSVGDELQTEYFVSRRDGQAAMLAVQALGDLLAPLLLVSEIRSVSADDFWLSPAYGRDSLAIHFTWRPDQPAAMAVLPSIEAALAPFAMRPHWGKLTTIPTADLRPRYPHFDDFVALVGRIDPAGVFRNDYLDRLLS